MTNKAELWDCEQIRDYLGVNTINSVYPWLSRHEVRPIDFRISEHGRVRHYYSAEAIRTIAASLPGSPGRGNRNSTHKKDSKR